MLSKLISIFFCLQHFVKMVYVPLNEYKSPGYSLFPVCSHRDINLPTIRFPHPTGIGHYFWSSCNRVYHILDRCRLIDTVCVMTPRGIWSHSVDPTAARVWQECAQMLSDTVACPNRIPEMIQIKIELASNKSDFRHSDRGQCLPSCVGEFTKTNGMRAIHYTNITVIVINENGFILLFLFCSQSRIM